jgi:hypothetical protein
MNKSFIVMVMTALLAVSLGAADVSGVWSLRLTTNDDESAPRASVTLKQDGDKLTGSCAIDNTEEAFTVTGEVSNNTVTWRCTSKGPIAASFKGTINQTGREMTGAWTTGASGGTFKGSKRSR